ncbi:sulfotransferase family 2 domain-containing protein [Cyanobium sp. ULC082]
MPFDFDKKLLFIHIPKNAGKYVEDRYKMSDYPGKQANQKNRSKLSSIARIVANKECANSKINLRGMIDIALVGQHLTLHEIDHYRLLPCSLASTTIFCISRNPFSRIISLYCHHTHSSKWSDQDLEVFCNTWPHDRSFIRHNLISHQLRQLDYLRRHDGSFYQVKVIRFEHLEEDLSSFDKEHSLQPDHYIGSALKLKQRMDNLHKPVRPKLTKHAAHLVLEHYSEDFRFFGYPLSVTQQDVM